MANQISPNPLIVFLIFVLSRPYPGIVQDAYIYIGRAIADLDPNGVGRDLMFVYDGQFGFSQFRPVADAMVWWFGLAAAAKLLAILAAFAWFFSVRAFLRQYASGAAVWVAVIFTVLLPSAYGATSPSFGFTELIAIPRPFAEALVLAGLAALAACGNAVATVSMVVAALVHPIMAATTIAIAAHFQQGRRRRIFAAILLAGVGGIAIAAIFGDGLSPFSAFKPSPGAWHG